VLISTPCQQYIDATKRGGIGRFLNHSCAPNCYVAKWTVGTHVRMGIFANRNILKDEELTFNYNVDRYGSVAFSSSFSPHINVSVAVMMHSLAIVVSQNVSDSSAERRRPTLELWMTFTSTVMQPPFFIIMCMTDRYSNNIQRLVLRMRLRCSALKVARRKRAKSWTRTIWFVTGLVPALPFSYEALPSQPILKPMVEKDVPKVVQAMRQTQSRKVLFKLLTRVKVCFALCSMSTLVDLLG